MLSSLYNSVCKGMLSLTNKLEMQSFSKIEKHLNKMPSECEEDAKEMQLLHWQYRNAEPIDQQGPRYYEQMYEFLGPQTVALSFMLRNYSPTNFMYSEKNELAVEAIWTGDDLLHQSAIYQALRTHSDQLQQSKGFSLFSPQGLSWFFSNRLGALFLKRKVGTYPEQFEAIFDSLTKYELKPGLPVMTARVSFDANTMAWNELYINSTKVTPDQKLMFEKASKILIGLAIMDCSIYWHAVICHLCVGELFTTATVRKLSCSNPLRKFLHSFTHGVFNISNIVRMVLITENGTLHTIFPFSASGVKQYINDAMQSFSMLQDLDANDRFPLTGVNLHQDMKRMWHMFERYNHEFFELIKTMPKYDEYEKEIKEWIYEIIRLQPNEQSRTTLRSAWSHHPARLYVHLVTMFQFHSCVTHDLSSMTNLLISDPFSGVYTMVNSQEVGKETCERAMVAAHSSDLEVLKLYNAWGDIVLPHANKHFAPLKDLMNSLPTRLDAFEQETDDLNRNRQFPNEALSLKNLRASICV